ncbi:Bifunctional glutamate/proline--tRNA ligase [Frankliniella fusca]|uniref:Bifunctional glutamate/proline--tRNA ligase n=1 Tax=Frankliniella fusca TaxID=407009 RepID=A0AAE1LMA9_9NEOP|nr:Bifunctional glutamate/proline--tRNA ligase [Frankliniella fusca]
MALRYLSSWKNVIGLLNQVDGFLCTRSLSVSLMEEDVSQLPQDIKPFQEIPGPTSLPIIGTFYLYALGVYSYEKPYESGIKKYSKYGPIVREETLPGQNTVLIFDPEDIKQLILYETTSYPCRKRHLALEKFRKSRPLIYCSGGLLSSNGEEWWRLRREFQEGFSDHEVVQAYLPATDRIIKNFVNRHILHNTDEDFMSVLSRLSLQLTSLIAFDEEFDPFSPEELQFDSRSFNIIESAYISNRSGHLIDHQQIMAKETLSVAVELVRKKARSLASSNRSHDSKEYVPSLLELYLASPSVDNKDVNGMAVDLLLAGIETTAITASFALYHLSKNQRVQDILRMEARSLLTSTDQTITPEVLSNARYAKAVLKEVFRINPTSVGVERLLSEDAVLSGYHVPKGTNVITQNQVLCRLDEYFTKPNVFLPERWMKGSPVFEKSNPFLVLPFGHGRRTCIARHLAEQQLTILLLRDRDKKKFCSAGSASFYKLPGKAKITMAFVLTASLSDAPIGALILAEYVKDSQKIEVEWSKETSLKVGSDSFSSVSAICRYLARISPKLRLYGSNILEQTEVDHWLSFSTGPLVCKTDFKDAVAYIDRVLGPITYLVGDKLTAADFAVWGSLYGNQKVSAALNSKEHLNVKRWFEFIRSLPVVQNVITALPNEAVSKPQSQINEETGRKEEGKFIDLPGAEMGKVVVRFPPEASGYLHIGHAKAALLNQYYQQAFKGKLIMRFDDTNPAKEKVILEDLKMLEIVPDQFTHTSSYFDLMLELCEKLMKEGKAYVDDTEPEQMKTEREQRVESKNRNNSLQKNLAMWNEMKQGTETGTKCCVRAKIDMNSPNGCMRDPTIYRCKPEPHPRTGSKYKVYPTYDFACPIVDSIEGVTHCLRTMEYHDRDDQFYWFIDALGLRKPVIWEYSRLNMTNTVLSKRKLTWFVEEGLVDGWDDPRFPTVRGVLRRGMTVEGLKQFIIAQGSSRSVVVMEWDKIWAFNKKVIDPIAPRFTALEAKDTVPVLVKGVKEECLEVAKHPKNPDIGVKKVWVGPRVLIDYADAEVLKEGENTTFINWGNMLIKKINRKGGRIESVEAEANLDNKDFKKTLKITWLAETPKGKFTPTYCLYYDHIISKPVLAKDEDFKSYIPKNTRTEVAMLGDPELAALKVGDIIQLQRRGFFRVDQAYEPLSPHIGKETPIVLIAIPDGHQKEIPTAGVPKKQEQAMSAKEKAQSAKGKVAEKSPVTENPSKLIGIRDASTVNALIVQQGDVVRKLKTDKADKPAIDEAVKILLDLKAEFKSACGLDWKPNIAVPTASVTEHAVSDEASLLSKIGEQGDKVRKIKADKAPKDQVDTAVKVLLDLKAEYKKVTGKDWKPGAQPSTPPPVVSAPAPTSAVGDLSAQITDQGDKVRKLKADKAAKKDIDAAVQVLLDLKAKYKSAAGQDWKPGQIISTSAAQLSSPTLASPSSACSELSNESGKRNELLEKISLQGDKVRTLKASKAAKSVVDQEVKTLLALKSEFKSVTGEDWKPDLKPTASVSTPSAPVNSNTAELNASIVQQGDKVRQLKAEKASKEVIDAEVKVLLSLKSNFKNLTGSDWKPGVVTIAPPVTQPTAMADNKVESLVSKVNEQGEKVRQLKSAGAGKDEVDAAVQILLGLKAEYKTVTGNDFPTAGRTPKPAKAASQPKEKSKPKQEKAVEDGQAVKKQTRLGMEARKEENLPDWYSQVIQKGEMIEYYDVSGCYILRPWSFAIWEQLSSWFDTEIKKLGVENCYFPIFVSRAALEKEKSHIADFSPEVAWVTKSGDSDMAEPIAIRPTSETVMYPAFAKWVQSYRDLPIKLNQWNNVVRWEFKHPQPFLRTREFLWQEGHTAFANQKDAEDEVYTILDLYARIYEELLAIPVVKGRKTEKEKFAGGYFTTTVEAFVAASGRAIQGATSHHLGQNFSKMFDIVFEDPETQEKKFAFQNSWGFTTRTIGVMIMVHADNQGLVLPPRVAPKQVVIVPCGVTVSMKEEEKNALFASCKELEDSLQKKNIRGVPIRVELGPKDLKNQQLVAVRRDNGEKITISRSKAAEDIAALLDAVQKALFEKASAELKIHTTICKKWEDFCNALEKKNIILTPFCGEISCEDKIKKDSVKDEAEQDAAGPAMGAKSLCIPFTQPAQITDSDHCIHPDCKAKPQKYTLFGRSY